MFFHEHQCQQALDFFRWFRLVLLPILAFARGPADMGAENVEHGLAQFFGVFRQMKEFVGTAQTHGVRWVAQVLDGVLQALLSLPLLGVLVGLGLLFRGLGLRLRCISLRFRGILHGLGAPVGSHSLHNQENTAHTNPKEF